MSETIGTRVREKRVSRGLTQEQLAAKSGVSQPTISRIERDGCEPGVRSLRALATHLGVTASWLLDGIARGRRKVA